MTDAFPDRELHRDGDEARLPGLFAYLVALIARFDAVTPEIER